MPGYHFHLTGVVTQQEVVQGVPASAHPDHHVSALEQLEKNKKFRELTEISMQIYHSQKSMLFTRTKTFFPAMLYFPSPTFFTLSFEHFPLAQLQFLCINLVACCTLLSSSVTSSPPPLTSISRSGSSPKQRKVGVEFFVDEESFVSSSIAQNRTYHSPLTIRLRYYRWEPRR